MIHHIFALKASADLPTWNLKRGNVQAVVREQPQTPTSTLSCQENAESAQVMGYVGELVTVQRQRHLQHQDELAGAVLREGLQAPADQILELRHEVQVRAWLTVSVLREVLQTLVKSRLELQHRTLQRKRCQLLNLSLLQDHDDNYRGTGLPQRYRAHLKELALQLVIQPSSLLHSTKMRMLLNNPSSDDAKSHLAMGVPRKGSHPDREESTLTRRPQEDLQDGRHLT